MAFASAAFASATRPSEEKRHAAVEEDGGALGQREPRGERFRALTALPEQGGAFVAGIGRKQFSAVSKSPISRARPAARIGCVEAFFSIQFLQSRQAGQGRLPAGRAQLGGLELVEQWLQIADALRKTPGRHRDRESGGGLVDERGPVGREVGPGRL